MYVFLCVYASMLCLVSVFAMFCFSVWDIFKEKICRGQKGQEKERGMTHADSHDVATSIHSHIHVFISLVDNMPSLFGSIFSFFNVNAVH